MLDILKYHGDDNEQIERMFVDYFDPLFPEVGKNGFPPFNNFDIIQSYVGFESLIIEYYAVDWI